MCDFIGKILKSRRCRRLKGQVTLKTFLSFTIQTTTDYKWIEVLLNRNKPINIRKLELITISTIIIKNIAKNFKNCKYSKTITADRLVSLINFVWSINDISVFATWSIGDRLISSIVLDKFCYICNFFKMLLYT